MTETQMEQEIQGACANLIPNQTMEQLMHKQMMQINLAEVKHEEIVFAKAIYESTSAEDKEAAKTSGFTARQSFSKSSSLQSNCSYV